MSCFSFDVKRKETGKLMQVGLLFSITAPTPHPRPSGTRGKHGLKSLAVQRFFFPGLPEGRELDKQERAWGLFWVGAW